MATGIPRLPGPRFVAGQSATGRGDEIAAVATSGPTFYASIVVRKGVIHPGEKTKP